MNHKKYKTRFLNAERLQKEQWGIVDTFRRHNRRVYVFGFLPPTNSHYQDFSYAEVRGWK